MSGWEILEGERGRGRPRVTWTDNIKDKTKSHIRQHQGVDGKYWREWWRVKETGRPRGTDNINEWMGNIGGNGGG